MCFSSPLESYSVKDECDSVRLTVGGGGGVATRGRIGRARDERRNSRKEVLPLFLVPMTRTLRKALDEVHPCQGEVGQSVLERCRILSPAESPRAVDIAYYGACIAVATAVGHALGPGSRIVRMSLAEMVAIGKRRESGG